MGPKDPHNGLTPAAFEARTLGFLGLGIVALGGVFCLPPIPQDLNSRSIILSALVQRSTRCTG